MYVSANHYLKRNEIELKKKHPILSKTLIRTSMAFMLTKIPYTSSSKLYSVHKIDNSQLLKLAPLFDTAKSR